MLKIKHNMMLIRKLPFSQGTQGVSSVSPRPPPLFLGSFFFCKCLTWLWPLQCQGTTSMSPWHLKVQKPSISFFEGPPEAVKWVSKQLKWTVLHRFDLTQTASGAAIEVIAGHVIQQIPQIWLTLISQQGHSPAGLRVTPCIE